MRFNRFYDGGQVNPFRDAQDQWRGRRTGLSEWDWMVLALAALAILGGLVILLTVIW